ncbi:hypothetical protein Vspart_04094 [Vibrio spartinae]|uniref:Uncharacterized protein n=1 Tax=Vibrio spartinae TaxID=1918945 RepID=A0ABX6R546_9VIBR|nr:hypothetical protein Vspart_04094 [Vibrio spartinae]
MHLKASSGQHVPQPNKKDFLVTLASWQELLAHRVPMPLKSQNIIVRQNLGPEAGNVEN